MNKLLSIMSLLVVLAMTFTSPSYAGSHEKKAEGTSESADEAKKTMESSEGTDKDTSEGKTDKKDEKKKKAEGDEEPECD